MYAYIIHKMIIHIIYKSLDGNNAGAIAGGVIGVILAVVITAVIIFISIYYWYFIYKRRNGTYVM